MSQDAPSNIMGFDLAIGLVKDIAPNKLNKLRDWCKSADWRDPNNDEARDYRQRGILPDPVKRAMNYPVRHMPIAGDLVVNKFYHYIGFEIENKIRREEMAKEKYLYLTDDAQWPLPEPALKED